MARRFDLGRALLAVGAIILLVSLFLDWYDPGLSGWEAFEALDIVLAGLALAGLWAALRGDLVPEWLGGAVAAAAVAVIVIQLIEPPPVVRGADPSTGAWLALAGSVLMAAGAVLSITRFAITVELREHDRRRRVPAVDRRNEDPAAAAEARPGGAVPVDESGRTQSFTALPEDDDVPDRP